MIEQVEEVRAEAQILSVRNLEDLLQGQVDVPLRGPDNAVARRVPVDSGVAITTCGKRSEWIRSISCRVNPVIRTITPDILLVAKPGELTSSE